MFYLEIRFIHDDIDKVTPACIRELSVHWRGSHSSPVTPLFTLYLCPVTAYYYS